MWVLNGLKRMHSSPRPWFPRRAWRRCSETPAGPGSAGPSSSSGSAKHAGATQKATHQAINKAGKKRRPELRTASTLQGLAVSCKESRRSRTPSKSVPFQSLRSLLSFFTPRGGPLQPDLEDLPRVQPGFDLEPHERAEGGDQRQAETRVAGFGARHILAPEAVEDPRQVVRLQGIRGVADRQEEACCRPRRRRTAPRCPPDCRPRRWRRD